MTHQEKTIELIAAFRLKPGEVAKIIGKSRTAVTLKIKNEDYQAFTEEQYQDVLKHCQRLYDAEKATLERIIKTKE